MTGLAWFKCYPRDFLDGMTGLTLEERGAYVTLLNLIYARGGELPDEPRWLAGNCLVSVRTWTKIRAALIVKGKLYLSDTGGLMNERALKEIEKSAKPPRKPHETSTKLPDNNELTSAKVADKVGENEPERNKINGLPVESVRPDDQQKRDIETEAEAEPESERLAAASRAPTRVDLDLWEALLREAAGKALNAASPALLNLAPILALMRPTSGEACDLEADVLPAVRACAAKLRPGSVQSWTYFRPAILEARDRRCTAAPPVQVIHDHPRRSDAREAAFLGKLEVVDSAMEQAVQQFAVGRGGG